jgi:sugar O-acyltransferase (sialic acid O-acetyltransferase NeuD family)
MNNPVVGIGAGGNAKVVIETLRLAGYRNIHGLLDPDRELWGKSVLCVTILGDDTLLPGLVAAGVNDFFIGVGAVTSLDPRRRLYDLACSCGMSPVPAIHPSAVISASACYGAGLTAMAGTVFNADARLGDNVLVNSGAIIEHDCIVGSHVHISPRALLLASVQVGDGTMIGAGAVVRQGVRIGSRVIVGAGAVVVNDVRDGETVVGVPARSIYLTRAR